MKKYLRMLEAHIKNAFASRAEGLVYFLADLMAPLILIIVWQAIFVGKDMVGGYTYSQMAIYYLLVFILRTILSVYPSEISVFIRTGELNMFLVKPMGMLGYLLTGEIAWKIVRLSFLVIAVFLLVIFVLGNVNLSKLIIDSPFLWASIIIGFLLNYYLKACVELLAFWIGETDGVRMSFYILETFFAGSFLPLTLMPSFVNNISRFLPYQYFYYFPIQIILGKTSQYESVINLIISVAWLAFAFMLSKIMFSQGLRRYSAYSG